MSRLRFYSLCSECKYKEGSRRGVWQIIGTYNRMVKLRFVGRFPHVHNPNVDVGSIVDISSNFEAQDWFGGWVMNIKDIIRRCA